MFVRLKEFHFINAPNFIDILMSMVKPFMKKEMLDMLKIHPVGSDSLEEYIPMAALPKEAEGNNKGGTVLRGETCSLPLTVYLYTNLKYSAHTVRCVQMLVYDLKYCNNKHKFLIL